MEVRTGLPQLGGREVCIWMPSGSEQTPRGHSGKCLRANQTLPEITSKPLKRMSECLRKRNVWGWGAEAGKRRGRGSLGPPLCRHTPQEGVKDGGYPKHGGSQLCQRILGIRTPCQTLDPLGLLVFRLMAVHPDRAPTV